MESLQNRSVLTNFLSEIDNGKTSYLRTIWHSFDGFTAHNRVMIIL